ncbi:MAG: M15 family metallopeptidase [Oscillospiraceae bacterium]|nr:M15 family metallopeptidase [Oscillospiraceae bacterium]
MGKTSKGYDIVVKDGITYIDGAVIVNKTYTLPKDYAPGFTGGTYKAFQVMQADAKKQGIKLEIISGFRSYQTQQNTYNGWVKQYGKEYADTISARPGHSEHQSGLAMDVNSLKFAFADTKEGIWLAENCWKYGFIIRYPEGKEDITGYKYEPWHIRYLGKELAKKVYDSGLCLEEYFGITSEYK